MTLRNFVRALDSKELVTVVAAISGDIIFDRKNKRELEAAPLFQVACQRMHVYRMTLGTCFGDLIVEVFKDWND